MKELQVVGATATHGVGEMWVVNVSGSARLDTAVREHASAAWLRTIALLDPPVEHLRLTLGGAMSTRYGQLAYTSFDVPGSAGGWQIKQVEGELSADETQILVAGMRTAFSIPSNRCRPT